MCILCKCVLVRFYCILVASAVLSCVLRPGSECNQYLEERKASSVNVYKVAHATLTSTFAMVPETYLNSNTIWPKVKVQ